MFIKASIPVKSVIPKDVADMVPVKACASATEISVSEFVLIAVTLALIPGLVLAYLYGPIFSSS